MSSFPSIICWKDNLSSIILSYTSVKNQLITNVWDYFWTLNSNLLIYMSVSTTGWRWSSNTLVTWCQRTNSLEKTLMLGKSEGRRRRGKPEEKIVGWHHRLNGQEFKQALGEAKEQGRLVCCSSWGRKESDMTEQLNNNKCQLLTLLHWNKFWNEEVWDLQLSFTHSESLHFFMILKIRCQFLFKKKKRQLKF